VREVVVARYGQDGRAERAQHLRRALELGAPASVREIAGSDHDLRLEPLHETCQSVLDVPLLMCTHVQVGNVEEAGVHDRTRL
jgi:hypothetical protein